ncbi:hypothetical protein AAHC03_019111 [Spirometra sp. Aus1]
MACIIRDSMMFVTATIALILLNVQFCSCFGFRLHVKPHTNIDLAYEVQASFRFNSSESGFTHRTPTHTCEPPTKCVEFYSRRRSFLINDGTYESYSAVILIPENPKKAKIAIVVVNETDFFAEIPGVHYIIPIVAHPGYARPVSVVMDENIKEIRLLGNISRYGSSSSRKGLKIIIPFEQADGVSYKIMRVTGRMETENLVFSLADNVGKKETYKFVAYHAAPPLMYPTHFLKWPKMNKTSGSLQQFKCSLFLSIIPILGLLLNNN